MHIGIDFDNTIVTYDALFHRLALDEGLIAPDVPVGKQAVRDAIRLLPQGNDRWTVLQGVVYGQRMGEAEAAEGVEEFLSACAARGIELSIISHKTEYPAMGPQVNLRDAARAWIADHGFQERFGIDDDHITFVGELTEKLRQVGLRQCRYFIDDLTEVLLHPQFPADVQRILYSAVPLPAAQCPPGMHCFSAWSEIGAFLLRDDRRP